MGHNLGKTKEICFTAAKIGRGLIGLIDGRYRLEPIDGYKKAEV